MKHITFLLTLFFAAVQVYAQTSQVITIAGTGSSGFANGQGTSASFSFPNGLDIDAAGNIYVVDNGNDVIRLISPTGSVSTFAGSGAAGWVNGSAATAQFDSPLGLVVLDNGDIIVSEFSHRMRRISAGTVTDYAGNGGAGSTNGIGTSALFNVPTQFAKDVNGDIVLTDRFNHKIRKINTTTVASSDVAGSGGQGLVNGSAGSAQFDRPYDLCMDQAGNIYVADRDNHVIRKIDMFGNVTTIAGTGSPGFANGNGTAASFNTPAGITIDKDGYLYVSDRLNNRIRKVDQSGNVTTFAGTGAAGSTDGPALSATLDYPLVIRADTNNNVLYFTETNSHTVRKITMEETFCDTLYITDTITLTDTVTITDTIWLTDTVILYDTIYLGKPMEGGGLHSVMAYPNPFHEEFTIEYHVVGEGRITFWIYDINGRLIQESNVAHHRAGTYRRLFQVPPFTADGNITIRMESQGSSSSIQLMQVR